MAVGSIPFSDSGEGGFFVSLSSDTPFSTISVEPDIFSSFLYDKNTKLS